LTDYELSIPSTENLAIDSAPTFAEIHRPYCLDEDEVRSRDPATRSALNRVARDARFRVRRSVSTATTSKGEHQDFKTDVAKEFGAVRTSLERTKVWMLTTGIATVLGVAALVGFKSH
jgi:hypothetical protein